MKRSDEREYDLEERTALFGEAVIEYCLTLPLNPVSSPVISQLVAAATSIGANYREADEAVSMKDFRHKIAICRMEAKETKFWLRMVAKAVTSKKSAAREFWAEAKELPLILCKIVRTTDKNLRLEAAVRRNATGGQPPLDIGH